MSYWELHRLSLPSIFLGLWYLPEVETLMATGFSASWGPHFPGVVWLTAWKVAAAQRGPIKTLETGHRLNPASAWGFLLWDYLVVTCSQSSLVHHNPTSPTPSLPQQCWKVQPSSRHIIQRHQRNDLETTQCPTSVAKQLSSLAALDFKGILCFNELLYN